MSVTPIPGADVSSYIAADGTLQETLVVEGASGGGGASGEVEVTNWPATQPVSIAATVAVSGPLTNAQLTAVTGTAAQTAVTTDPTSAGQTLAALLRGILQEMQAQTALLEAIADNTSG